MDLRLLLPVRFADIPLLAALFCLAALATVAMLPKQTQTGEVWMQIVLAAMLAGIILFALLRQRTTAKKHATDPHLWEALADNMPFGIASWDDQGRLTAFNSGFADALVLNAGDFGPGSLYGDLVRDLMTRYEISLAGESESTRALELRCTDGRWLQIDESVLPDGGFVTVATDISRTKETSQLVSSIQEDQRQFARRFEDEKRKAEAASRSKTAFLAHLSHDIRTPLNHIIGFADLIRHQTYGSLGDARYLDYVGHIKDAGENLLASFAEILELAELETGKRELREEPVEVLDLLEATRNRFRDQARQRRIKLTVSEPARARLSGDPLGLQRMIGNLVENAIRFTPAGGIVCLTSWRAEDGVVIEVSDTGIGMSEEKLAGLTEPFVLGDAAFTRDHDGVGLGFAISRSIAELSGGQIAIESSLGIGTTVAVTLPFVRGAGAVTQQAA